MTHSGESPSPLLSPAQIAALQAVKVDLHFGVHGIQRFTDYGPATLAVSDQDYERSKQIVANLNAKRGDVYAYEESGFNTIWRPANFLLSLADHVRTSPFVDTTRYRLVENSRETPPSPDDIKLDPFYHANRRDLEDFAQRLRDFQIISTILYSCLEATAKGIRFEPADANQQEKQEWRDHLATLSPLENIVVDQAQAERHFRDRKMVRRLGEIAVTMPVTNPADPPHLALQGGVHHKSGVSRLLSAHNIPHTVTRYTSPLSEWLLVLKPSQQKQVKDWVARAKRLQETGGA